MAGAEGGCTVVTDHQPNTCLDSKPAVKLSSRQVHWQQFLSRFHFDWEYRKGCLNVADPVSRNPALYTLSADNFDKDIPDIYDTLDCFEQFLQGIRNGYEQDAWFANTVNLTVVRGYWRKDGLIFVPSAVRSECASLHHDTHWAGPLGRDRTKQLIMQTYWGSSIDGDVRQFVSTCTFCEQNKTSNQKPAGLLKTTVDT